MAAARPSDYSDGAMNRTLRSISASRCCLSLVLAAGLGAAPVVAQSSGSTSTSRDSEASTATTDRASTSRDSSSMRTSSSTSKLDKSDKTFLEKAAKSSMKEAALSQLAAQKATNADVRQYAEEIATDHHRVNQQLMQLAQKKGVTLDVAKHSGSSGTTGSTRTTAGGPTSASSTGTDRAQADASGGTMATAGTTRSSTTTSSAESMSHMAMSDDRDYKNLAEESGREFDEQYVELMVQEHEKAVELFEEAAEEATDQEVRSFASMHVDSLREHLQEAKSLQRAVAE